MEEKVTHPKFGELIDYKPHRGHKKTFHDFVFKDNKEGKENYVVVAIDGKDKEKILKEGELPTLTETNDLFFKPFLKKNNAVVTYTERVKILDNILNSKGNKGYEIFRGWMGYAKHIDLENQNDSLGLMILSDMAGIREREFHFNVKPYKSLEALKYQYQNRIKSRKIFRERQMINPSEINEQRLILSVIEDYEREVKEKISKTGIDRLVGEDKDNAILFLNWLEKEKEKQLEYNSFKSFDELFSNAYNQGLHITDTGNVKPLVKEIEKSLCDLSFSLWLNEKFGYEAGDENYGDYLTIHTYKEFLKYHIKKMKDQNSEYWKRFEKNKKDIGLIDEKESIKEEVFEPLEFENLSQKLLLLESLGVLKAVSEKTGVDISSRKMGRIIADFLSEKETTTTRALRYFNPYSQPKDKNNPRTENNLTLLHRNLVKLKLPTLEKEVEEELNRISLEED